MAKRDLNDQHRDGDLDLDTIEPLPTPDLDLPTAEDLLLATLCQAIKAGMLVHADGSAFRAQLGKSPPVAMIE